MHVAKGLFGLKLIIQFMGYTKILCVHVTHLIKMLRKMKRPFYQIFLYILLMFV